VPNVGVKIDKPLICAVQGWAVGAGFTLTMMRDLCVVDETAHFMFPEAKIGLFGGITAGLVSRIPHKVAVEFLMLGDPLPAQRAYEVGPEFFDTFLSEDIGYERFFAGGTGDRMHFDLPGFALHRLRSAGVGHAEWNGHCTYSNPALFFSFRRSVHEKQADYGRLISTIRL